MKFLRIRETERFSHLAKVCITLQVNMVMLSWGKKKVNSGNDKEIIYWTSVIRSSSWDFPREVMIRCSGLESIRSPFCFERVSLMPLALLPWFWEMLSSQMHSDTEALMSLIIKGTRSGTIFPPSWGWAVILGWGHQIILWLSIAKSRKVFKTYQPCPQCQLLNFRH